MPPTIATETLLLRPGMPVVRRDPDTLQVGLTPPATVRLPHRPAVVALLDELRCGRAGEPSDAEARAALHALRSADLVLTAAPDASWGDLGPALAQFGSDAVRRQRQRSAQRVGVLADPPTRRVLDELLEAGGVTADPDAATVWLVVGPGEVPRGRIDPLQRAGVPHLVVTGRGGGRRLGPFVEPGRTACLRCVDAHESADDPRRPFLVEQAALAGDPAPVDPVLERLALSWAVRDLARYLEGDEPSTWSATVDLGPTAAPRVTRWLRHPHCGCAWDTLVDLP